MDAEFLGREAELGELAERFDRASRGEGSLVLLAGEAGVGKTTLAEYAVPRDGWVSTVGRCSDGGTSPYEPLARALRALKRPGSVPPSGALAAQLAMVQPELGEAPEVADRGLLVEALADRLTSGDPAPAVVLLDDLQWADEATLDLLPALADRLANEAIVVLGTYRSDDLVRGHPVRRLRDELRRARRLVEIEIRPFGLAETARAVERGLGGAPHPELAERIHERTLGVPLFVEELTATLASGGRVHAGPDGLVLRGEEPFPLPESVRDAVVLRLDGLSPASREPLDIAALAGTEFDRQLVTELAGGDDTLDELFDRQLLREAGSGRAAFRHALTREAVAAEIPWSRRAALHARIAEWLEAHGALPEPIAEHWLAARNHERARRALLAAAERSCRLHAHRDAARSADRALEIWPDGEEEARIETLEQVARCSQLGGELAGAVRAWRELVESPVVREDAERRAGAQRSLAIAQGLAGTWEQAMASRAAARASWLEAGRTGEAAVDRLAEAGHLTSTLHLNEASAAVAEAVDLARDGARTDVQARALGLQGVLLAMQGDAEAGVVRVREGLSLALEHGELEAAGEVYRRLGNALDYAADYAGARDAYVEALGFCRSRGQDSAVQVCLGCMGWILVRTGEWSKALEVCREVADDAPPGTRAGAAAVAGLVHAYRGETGPARRALERGLELARRAEVLTIEALVEWSFALVQEGTGNDAAAADHYRAMVHAWKSTQDRHDIVPGLWHGVTFFGSRGLAADAAACTEGLVTIATTAGTAENLGALAHALGETALVAGDGTEAVRQFRQALAHFDELDAPAERVLTAWRTAAALDSIGERQEAVELLSGAYRVARRLGARPLAARVASLLSELGAAASERGEPAADAAGRAGLTRRQAEVARLLADGLTNREIAGQLFVSPRTVDMHVGHILERLDCRSRTEAARRVSELGLLD